MPSPSALVRWLVAGACVTALALGASPAFAQEVEDDVVLDDASTDDVVDDVVDDNDVFIMDPGPDDIVDTDAVPPADSSSPDSSGSDGSVPSDATAPDGGSCPAGARGCARADISYRHRAGIPVEWDIDTGFVPAGSPLQVRFHTVFVGHTDVSLAGVLEGSWPRAMTLRALGNRAGGAIESDFGLVLEARVRVHLDIGIRTFDWEGAIPYIPMVDIRARANRTFDPWAWDGVSIMGATMRAHIADVPITTAIIPIPGIAGGFSFDAQLELQTNYRSTRITFGMDADPITAMMERTLAVFTMGSRVTYSPQLEGRIAWTPGVHVYPSFYVTLLGSRFTLALPDLPIRLPAVNNDVRFNPSRATLLLPDVTRIERVRDFGSVTVGTTARETVPFESVGDVPLWLAPPAMAPTPFSFPRAEFTVGPHMTGDLPVEFMPTAPGPFEQRVLVQTSDPDSPEVTLVLRGTGVMGVVPPPDGSIPTDGTPGADGAASGDGSRDGGTGSRAPGCGCRTAGESHGSAALWAIVGLGGLFVRRRRSVPSTR